MQALGIYPVLETIDGSSSVYFQAVDHEEIRVYVQRVAEALQISGQLAFDFIETGVSEDDLRIRSRKSKSKSRKESESSGSSNDADRNTNPVHRLAAIECNPRATSGIHLWSCTPRLAQVLATGIPSPYVSTLNTEISPIPPAVLTAKPGSRRQVGPGMLMWEHKDANFQRYIEHMGRLLSTRDVIWSWRDIFPVLVQPFLLTSYYEICRERGGMSLPDMFQDDLIWEPKHLNLDTDTSSPEDSERSRLDGREDTANEESAT